MGKEMQTIPEILQSPSDLSSGLIASNRGEMREGIEARRGYVAGWLEGKGGGGVRGNGRIYCGNRTEHLHGRTTLGYESAQGD